MKQVVYSLYHSVKNELSNMKKSNMSISDRVAYEKAVAKLEAIKLIIDQFNF